MVRDTPDEVAKKIGSNAEAPDPNYRFGAFRLLPGRQSLLHRDEPVCLGSRAFDLLTLLVSRAGEVVSKAELVTHAWPDSLVHQDNLKVNIASLRKILAAHDRSIDLIKTIPGRGYKFVGTVDRGGSKEAHTPFSFRLHSGGLPEARKIFGRDNEVRSIAEMLDQPGYVNLIGPGGVGKTSVAVAVAKHIYGEDRDRIAFVDLSTINDSSFVVAALASAVGVSLAHNDALSGVIDVCRSGQTLLIVDNCEHVSAMAAAAIDRIAAALPQARILATSREPLRTRHERIYFLPGLAYPPRGQQTSAKEALDFPAVQLFVARAKASAPLHLTDEDITSIASICARLDGIALAIELAAGKVASFAPAALDALLKEDLHNLGHGARDAPLRHQTLEATLDWSYRLLPEGEAVLLRLLSVFSGRFTADDAGALFATGCLDPMTGRDALSQLLTKSLVSAEYDNGTVCYRLPESTRSYAGQRLSAAPERDRALRQFAVLIREKFQSAEQAWSTDASQQWLQKCRGRIDDVRSVISWAFRPQGDRQIGVDLVVAALPLWQELSAFKEMLAVVELAMSASRNLPEQPGLAGVKLAIARAWAKTLGLRLEPDTGEAWRESIRRAADAQSLEYELRAVWGRAVYLAYTGRPLQALRDLERYSITSGLDWSASPDSERLLAHIEVYAGRLDLATRRLERISVAWAYVEDRPGLSRFQMDLPVAINMSLSFVLWLRGETGPASRRATDAIARANKLGHLVSQGNAISLAALPIAYLEGDLAGASQLQRQLAEIGARESISIWPGTCKFFAGAIDAAKGQIGGLAGMHDGLAELVQGGWLTRTAFYRCLIADALIAEGEVDRAEICLEGALSDRRLREERWCHPEVLRVAGLIRAKRGQRMEAERLYVKAMRCARSMGAVSLELRAAKSMRDSAILAT